MLTLFPLQWLALIAYFILRIMVGGAVLYLGLQHYRQRSALTNVMRPPLFPFPKAATTLIISTEFVIALLLIPGIYTQIGAILLISLAIKMLCWRERLGGNLLPPRLTFVLLLACGLSLFITGAGILAIDLPL